MRIPGIKKGFQEQGLVQGTRGFQGQGWSQGQGDSRDRESPRDRGGVPECGIVPGIGMGISRAWDGPKDRGAHRDRGGPRDRKNSRDEGAPRNRVGMSQRWKWSQGHGVGQGQGQGFPMAGRVPPMCWMMWLMVGWNSSFMASGDIRSIPWDDHFTRLTLGGDKQGTRA